MTALTAIPLADPERYRRQALDFAAMHIGADLLAPKLERRTQDAALADLLLKYVQGASTRKVAQITQELRGVELTSAQVSRASQLLDEGLEIWRTQPLGEIPCLVLDARYEKVRHGGHIVDVALLIAVGVQAEGKRTVLGVSVSLSEAETHWRSFLTTLLERGLHGVT